VRGIWDWEERSLGRGEAAHHLLLEVKLALPSRFLCLAFLGPLAFGGVGRPELEWWGLHTARQSGYGRTNEMVPPPA